MVTCPNCGQSISGSECQFCHYPIASSLQIKAEKKARKDAERAATEKAEQDAIDTRKAKEAEEKAGKDAERAAREKAKQDAIDTRKAKEAEEKAGKDAEEAVRASQEAINRTEQVSRSAIETIEAAKKAFETAIGKAGEKVRKEAERAATEKAEQDAIDTRKAKEAEEKAGKDAERAATEKAKQDAIDTRKAKEAEEKAGKDAERAAREKAKQDDINTRKAKEAEEKAGKDAERAAREKAKQDAIDAKKKAKQDDIAVKDKGKIYEGNLILFVQSSNGYEQVSQFEQYLKEIEDLKIVWTGGSAQYEGLMFGIAAQKPMTLIQTINEIPVVEQVVEKKNNIIVIQKTPTIS